MDRNKGFINVTKLLGLKIPPIFQNQNILRYFFKEIKDIPDVEFIRKDEKRKKFCFSFLYQGERYFFKYDKMTLPYTELLVEEFCDMIGLSCASYDLAYLGAYKGVISKDFRVPGAEYISGGDILKAYCSRVIPTYSEESQKSYVGVTLNSLEIIWEALAYYYKDEEAIQRIMDKLVKSMILDILVGNPDHHYQNWQLVKYHNGTIDLAPSFDNARATSMPIEETMPELWVSSWAHNMRELKEELFKTGAKEYQDLFYECAKIISPLSLNIAFQRIEEKTKAKVPENIQSFYYERFRAWRVYLGLETDEKKMP